jgi:uncharacterized protein (TIGR03083 family)
MDHVARFAIHNVTNVCTGRRFRIGVLWKHCRLHILSLDLVCECAAQSAGGLGSMQALIQPFTLALHAASSALGRTESVPATVYCQMRCPVKHACPDVAGNTVATDPPDFGLSREIGSLDRTAASPAELRYNAPIMQTACESSLRPPPPVLVVDLFPELLEALLALLEGLPAEDWESPTACSGWTVKDVALHLLGVDVGNLSRRRDGHKLSGSATGWDELVALINDWNQSWVDVMRRVSPQLLIDLLRFVGAQMCDYFRSLDPYALGGAVSWAGPEPAPIWLDLAREYTERWHHQQHIRDAVGRPGLKGPRYLAPALATFVRALPHAFRETTAAEGTAATLTITGESGGRWSVRREAGAWELYAGAPERPDAEANIDQDTAWRLFTRGLPPDRARDQIAVRGDRQLAFTVLETVSIIA